MNAIVLSLPGSEHVAVRLAELAHIPSGALELRRFPDGETYVRIDTDCREKTVVIVCTLDRPDDNVLRLIFLADAARQLGASRVGLVAPYLAYLRQDRQFRPGEAVTSRTFAVLLSHYIDWLVTIDPHLHRYRSLAEIYSVPHRVLHAAPLLAEWITRHVHRPVIVGPDHESEQWVADVAKKAGAPYVVCKKDRLYDGTVAVRVPNTALHRTRTPVVIDDIISSAQTMIATVKHLVATGLPAPRCLAVHALLSGDAEDALRAAGAAAIVTTTSVPHQTNAIDIAPLLGPAVREFMSL